MGELEKFLHDKPQRTSTLIKAALAHAQFETVHPFLDGNGRLGRLLITLLLCSEGVLKEPLLYLSLYFKTHRQQYYDLLQTVRTEGDWEKWVEFFITAVKETSEQAVQTVDKLIKVAEEDREKIKSIGRSAGSAISSSSCSVSKAGYFYCQNLRDNRSVDYHCDRCNETSGETWNC